MVTREVSTNASTPDSHCLLPLNGHPFAIGISRDFPDSILALEMKDYRNMSKAQLLARINQIRSRHATRSRAQRRKAASELGDSTERLRAILETAVEGIITIDERGLIESFNLAAEKIFGYQSKEILGKNISLLMPSPHSEQHDRYMGDYLRTGHAKIIGIGREVTGRRKDGTIFPMDLSVSEVRLAKRRLFTGFIRDITERKQAEKALLHYAALVESSEDAIVGKTLDGRVTSWNKGAERVFGYKWKEMVGKPIAILFPTDRRNEGLEILERIKRGESVDHYETKRRRKDGRVIDISVTISPIRDNQGRIIGASKVARDITERKRLEREILEISEREQRRIGQDLHDGLCQHLAGIELMSQVLEQKLTRRSKVAAARASEIAKNVRDAISHTRLLARGLSPVTLDSEGLMAALSELSLSTEKIFRIVCRFECTPPVLVSNHAAATHLFRIAQEAISNAIKHGQAKRILIRLQERHGRLSLSIIDNGLGFPARLRRSKGMGLRIMQSRAGMIGGTLSVGRNTAGGTSVAVAVRNPAARQQSTNVHHAIQKQVI